MESDDSIRFAQATKDLVNSHSYKLTVGAWLEEMRNAAIQKLIYLEMGDQAIWQCQAELKVVDLIYTKIQAQVNKLEHLRLKKLKTEEKEKSHDNGNIG